jgi:hypothetical protein
MTHSRKHAPEPKQSLPAAARFSAAAAHAINLRVYGLWQSAQPEAFYKTRYYANSSATSVLPIKFVPDIGSTYWKKRPEGVLFSRLVQSIPKAE